MSDIAAASPTVSLAVTGSGGAGAVTTGTLLLAAAARAGWYGRMARSSGPQIRGGESAVMLRLGRQPVEAPDDNFQALLALDWRNVARFADEIPLTGDSLIFHDPDAGDVPAAVAASGARVVAVPLARVAGESGARPNMVALGLLAAAIGVSPDQVVDVMTAALDTKGDQILAASRAGVEAGYRLAAEAAPMLVTAPPPEPTARWNISGNEATGLGALKGGIRMAAAYPITPASELLEWLAPRLASLGGSLVQAEDELASINMIVGASYGGVPAMTATSGPGLALMLEGIGLAVASEIPVVIVNVMRGGPSTGIPTKSEQTDLGMALYGLHGDAPHLVIAPVSIDDCVAATQWAVHLAETLQAPAIVLTDQAMAQTRGVIDPPAAMSWPSQRRLAAPDGTPYRRYALTDDGVSPMALPGMAGLQYTADGLEHDERGTPSSIAVHHAAQLDKRERKLERHDYGDAWARIDGAGDTAVITWGSSFGAAREAIARAARDGVSVRLIAPRLLLPARPEAMADALNGVKRLLVVEQSHTGQFYKYLRAHYELPAQTRLMAVPGPLPIRPGRIYNALMNRESP